MYKLIETEKSQIYRFANQLAPIPKKINEGGQVAEVDLKCHKCSFIVKIQANIGKKQLLQKGLIEFPQNNQLKCPSCQLFSPLYNPD